MTTTQEIEQIGYTLNDGDYLVKVTRIYELLNKLPAEEGRKLYYQIFPYAD